MTNTDDQALLERYVKAGSRDALQVLLLRYADLVYSAAYRQVRHRQLAEDVTQATFLVLAQKAGAIRPGTLLAGWLFNVARYTAANAMKTEARRRYHERQADRPELIVQSHEPNWEEISPVLDRAVASLSSNDRNAILLRFFQGKSLREVAAATGISEKAATKRVARAILRLRGVFIKRGLTMSEMTLGSVLMSQAIQPAPSGLVNAINVSLTNGTAAAGTAAGIAKGAITAMTVAKIKIAAAILAGCVTLTAGAIGVERALAAGTRPDAPAQAAVPAATQPAVPAGAAAPAHAGATVVTLALTEKTDLAGLKIISADEDVVPTIKWTVDGAKPDYLGIMVVPAERPDIQNIKTGKFWQMLNTPKDQQWCVMGLPGTVTSAEYGQSWPEMKNIAEWHSAEPLTKGYYLLMVLGYQGEFRPTEGRQPILRGGAVLRIGNPPEPQKVDTSTLTPAQMTPKLKEWVEDFFTGNFRDITARKPLEWGQATKTPDGNWSIRYKYQATIRNKDKIVQNKLFTFTPEGGFVAVADAGAAK